VNWTGTTVFVTGADGFIGSHLAEALVEAGADVSALAHYNSFDSCGWLDESPLREHMQIFRGDIRDIEQMREFLRGKEIVLHLAALISVPHSYTAPRSYIETNVTGTMNVLLAAREARRIVCTSTSEVYGTAQVVPIPESHPIAPQSPYAASKVGADAVCRAFRLCHRVPVIVLRPFNTYGPRQSERAFIPSIVRQALDPKVAVIKTGDLVPKRDLTFVTDMVAAFMAVADLESSHVLNAGNGLSVTMAAIVDRILRKAGNKAMAFDPKRARPEDSEVMDLCADAGELRVSTGWEPKMTLNEGIGETVAWWRKRMHRVRPGSNHVV
jgi:nucleoside-diphosphate-sugar epimerase